MQRKPIAERVMEKFLPEPNSGCWLWTAGIDRHGYGMVWSNDDGGKMIYAHRVIYELHCQPIPSGYQIDHLCRNPACVNPAHLEPVTQQENLRRKPKPVACPKGHPYNGKTVGRCPKCSKQRLERWLESPANRARQREYKRNWYHRSKGMKPEEAR